jgi:hypothetical protein
MLLLKLQDEPEKKEKKMQETQLVANSEEFIILENGDSEKHKPFIEKDFENSRAEGVLGKDGCGY